MFYSLIKIIKKTSLMHTQEIDEVLYKFISPFVNWIKNIQIIKKGWAELQLYRSWKLYNNFKITYLRKLNS